jgi:hypothetical protein
MATQHITLTELEDRLAAPGGRELRDQLIAQLAQLERRLAERSRGLLPRDEFQLTGKALEAVRAAIYTLNQWVVGTGPATSRPR